MVDVTDAIMVLLVLSLALYVVVSYSREWWEVHQMVRRENRWVKRNRY